MLTFSDKIENNFSNSWSQIQTETITEHLLLMACHPTQYYSFNVFTSEQATVCPLLQTSFLLHKMHPKLFIRAPNFVLKTAFSFCTIQLAAKMYILCQALSSECLEI